MKDIKIVATRIYHEEACPLWLSRGKQFDIIEITGSCGEDDVDALLWGLLDYNSLSLSETPADSLKLLIDGMNQEEILLSGGLLFQDDDTCITPSCCCGLEQWCKIVSDIREKKKPWMGHDPWGTCLYQNGKTIVCSDDTGDSRIDENLIDKIVFDDSELELFFKQLEDDMKGFTFGPLHRRISALAPQLADEFCQTWDYYFN